MNRWRMRLPLSSVYFMRSSCRAQQSSTRKRRKVWAWAHGNNAAFYLCTLAKNNVDDLSSAETQCLHNEEKKALKEEYTAAESSLKVARAAHKALSTVCMFTFNETFERKLSWCVMLDIPVYSCGVNLVWTLHRDRLKYWQKTWSYLQS